LEIAFLELYRRDVASGIVPTLGVAKHLDVIEDISPSVLPGEIDLTANAFALEQLEEALGHRVVMAVTSPTHAADGMKMTRGGCGQNLGLLRGSSCIHTKREFVQ
jgi:hypothetical protein